MPVYPEFETRQSLASNCVKPQQDQMGNECPDWMKAWVMFPASRINA
jgi:hypothetical protein